MAGYFQINQTEKFTLNWSLY